MEGQLGFWLHSIDQIEKWSNFILPINLHVINIQIEAIFPFRTISSTYHGIQKSISFYFKQFLSVLQKHMVFQTFRSMEKEFISAKIVLLFYWLKLRKNQTSENSNEMMVMNFKIKGEEVIWPMGDQNANCLHRSKVWRGALKRVWLWEWGPNPMIWSIDFEGCRYHRTLWLL